MLSPPSGRTRGLAAFVVAFSTLLAVRIIVLIVIPDAARNIRAEVDFIVSNALTSVRLLHRLVLDNEEEHRLLETHVDTKDAGRMNELEKEIVAVEADYASAAREYEPLATGPGESAAWQRLQQDVTEVRQRIPVVLELSRRNSDPEALTALTAMDGLFAALERDGRALVELNAQEAARAQSRITTLQRRRDYRVRALDALGFAAMLGLVALTFGFFRRQAIEMRQRGALELRNRELDAFAGRVAHDLRGPLATLKLTSSLLVSRVPGERANAERLERSIARMDVLIGDLLALSRIESNARGGCCDPAVVAAELGEELRPRVDTEGGTLQVEVTPASVACRDGLLRQALWNLADNALNYRRPDQPPEVALRGRLSGRWYEVRVTDNGPGMSAEESRRAFEPFYRGAEAQERKPGTGLGLSIVKRVVEASGGDVSVVSESGRGTTFVLRLPLASS
jgi:signal transduction histidine kinase